MQGPVLGDTRGDAPLENSLRILSLPLVDSWGTQIGHRRTEYPTNDSVWRPNPFQGVASKPDN